MLQNKVNRFKQLDNNVRTTCRQNNNLRDLQKEYAEEIATIKADFSVELKQAERLELDTDDIYISMYACMVDCAKEFEYKVKVKDLETPAKPRKRTFKSVEQFLNSTDNLYGTRVKCREYAQIMRAKCEEDILKYCQSQYDEAYEKAYKNQIKENKKLLKQIRGE